MSPSARQRLAAHERLAWPLWCALVVCAAAAAFYLPALRKTGGRWPAPLDDVYIYYDFARSAALGAPFSWLPGNGYSSGATSALYPLLLAPAWAAGLRGSSLGVAAAALAIVSLIDLCGSLREVLGRRPVSFLLPPLVVAVPLLDWSWFSGMECALVGALLGRALRASARALAAPADRRARVQLGAGGWLALVVLSRPETLACCAGLALAMVHGARSLKTWPSLARVGGPAALGLGARAAVELWLTGEAMPAGAVRKLIWSVPYTDGPSAALQWLRNLVVLLDQAFVRSLGSWPLAMAVVSLAVAGLLSRRHRRLSAALWLGVVGGLLLVSCNTTARYQNYRYSAPLLAMLLSAAALGIDTLLRHRRMRYLALPLVALTLLAPASQLRRQITHFAQASANILAQQGEVARRLAAMRPSPRRVLVNDAGAIPYLSGIAALDGLGLGGFRRLPFARASVQGPAAVVELIERLGDHDRPDVMAIYPGWWGGLVDHFGHRIDAVRIDHNVICAADEKVIYAANWSDLAPAGEQRPAEIDALDVADVVAERRHRYAISPPHSGRLISATRRLRTTERWRYDAGRIVPKGGFESFTLADSVSAGPATLRLRTDRPLTGDGACRLVVEQRRSHQLRAQIAPTVLDATGERWIALAAPLAEVAAGDELRVRTLGCPWRSYHLWLLR